MSTEIAGSKRLYVLCPSLLGRLVKIRTRSPPEANGNAKPWSWRRVTRGDSQAWLRDHARMRWGLVVSNQRDNESQLLEAVSTELKLRTYVGGYESTQVQVRRHIPVPSFSTTTPSISGRVAVLKPPNTPLHNSATPHRSKKATSISMLKQCWSCAERCRDQDADHPRISQPAHAACTSCSCMGINRKNAMHPTVG
jgi:hypothetical protein